MLIKVANKDTESAVSALIKQSRQLPSELYRSLTWDRGKELADHQRLTLATNVDIYFCGPRTPWQRGSNENTNRLLRQYLPRGPISRYTAKPGSVPLQGSSMSDHGNCFIRCRLRGLPNVLQRSVEITVFLGHSNLLTTAPQSAYRGNCSIIKGTVLGEWV